MLIPANLREQARHCLDVAADEHTPRLRRYLANHALALAQLAERVEREQVDLSDPEEA